jgi:hypothetical protein
MMTSKPQTREKARRNRSLALDLLVAEAGAEGVSVFATGLPAAA